jgi:hypothetical protein
MAVGKASANALVVKRVNLCFMSSVFKRRQVWFLFGVFIPKIGICPVIVVASGKSPDEISP